MPEHKKYVSYSEGQTCPFIKTYGEDNLFNKLE